MFIQFQDMAVKNITGKLEFPLTLTWLSGQPPEDRLGSHGNSASGVKETTSGDASFSTFPQVSRVCFKQLNS